MLLKSLSLWRKQPEHSTAPPASPTGSTDSQTAITSDQICSDQKKCRL